VPTFKGREVGRGRGKGEEEGKEKGRDLLYQCQTASYAPVNEVILNVDYP